MTSSIQKPLQILFFVWFLKWSEAQCESKFRECAVHNEVSYNNWGTIDLNTAKLDHAQTDFRTVPSRPQGSVRPHLQRPFPCTALLVQSNSSFLIGSLRYTITAFEWLIDWLIRGGIFLPCLAVVFRPNNCLFVTAFIKSSRNVDTPKKSNY